MNGGLRPGGASPPELPDLDPALVLRSERVALWIGVLVAAPAMVILVAWAGGVLPLARINPSWTPVRPASAVLLTAVGVAVAAAGSGHRRRNILVVSGGALAVVAGMLTLIESSGLVDLHLRALLFPERVGGLAPAERRLPLNSGAAFLLLGVGLLSLGWTHRRAAAIREAAAFAALAISYVAILGYVLDAAGLYRIGRRVEMAFLTAILIGLAAVAVAQVRPDGPTLRILVSPLAASRLVRRLLPLLIALPPVLGWLRIAGQNDGLYTFEVGVALMVAATTVLLLVALLWYGAAALRSERAQIATDRALARANEMYRDLVTNASYGIFHATPDGRVAAANPGFAATLGFGSADEVLNLSLDDVYVDPGVRQRTCDVESGPFRGVEARWRRRDGRIIHVLLSGRPILGVGDGITFETFAEDITDRRELEEQLRHSQKLEALGRLAGGVAHDFNNLLTALRGYLELARGGLEPEHPVMADLAEVDRAAERAARLTRQLLAFGRRQVLEVTVLDLNALVSEMERLLRRLIGEDVQLDVRLEPGLGSIRGDAGQVEQVIANMVVNARDALPSGGRIIIETRNAPLDVAYAELHADVVPGDYVLLQVADTGLGMDRETAARIFEPFFTTKAPGKGTGLGLATVYGIVTQSGGHLWVDSEPNVGTTFKVYFPRVPGDRAAAADAAAGVSGRGGSGTILLVEDEPSVRGLTARMLAANGYRVLSASSGSEALALLAEHGPAVDLMLTDVVMEGMRGTTLARLVAAEHPHVRILFMSGYSMDVIDDETIGEGALLEKPFTTQQLLEHVRALLDREPGGSAEAIS